LKSHYIDLEQKHTKIDLNSKLKLTKYSSPDNDIVVKFDAKQLNKDSFNIIPQLSEIISEAGEIGEFELDIFKISIYALTTYEHTLINIYNK